MPSKVPPKQVSTAHIRLDVTTDTSKTPISSREAQSPRTHSVDVVDTISTEDQQNEPVPVDVKGWRLYLLTIGWVQSQASFPPSDLDAGSTPKESNLGQSMGLPLSLHHRNNNSQYCTRVHHGCSARLRLPRLGCHILSSDIHRYVPYDRTCVKGRNF